MVGLSESTALFLRSIRHTAVLDAIDVVEVFNHAAVVGDADNGTAFFAGDLAKQCHHTFSSPSALLNFASATNVDAASVSNCAWEIDLLLSRGRLRSRFSVARDS